MGGLVWNTAALGESQQPPFGPAPAPLDGPELPSFRFPLGAQKTEQFKGGTAKEANVTGFPVSEKIARVYVNEAFSAGSLDASTTVVPAAMNRVALGKYVAGEFDGSKR